MEDLVTTLPFRYEDRSRRQSVRELRENDAAVVVAQIHSLAFHRTRRGVTTLDLLVTDGTGMLRCAWFHADYLRDRLQTGQTLALYGRLVREQGRLLLRQPELEILPAAAAAAELSSLRLGRIVPVYEAIGVLGPARLRRLVHTALQRLPHSLPDPLPESIRQSLQLPSRGDALQQVHFPASGVSLQDLESARTPGHRRLIFEELFFLQAGLDLKRRHLQRQPGPVIAVTPAVRTALKRILPFHPTADQKLVLREIAQDLASTRPMRRLLQGDVGSGKTIVALQAAVLAIENGFQVAFMAPTQILAEQHFLYAREHLPGYRVALLTGSHRPPLTPGTPPQLLIGTHALIEGSVHFERLGLVIVDEQHRFGVLQRFQLMHKGADGDWAAHLLVMTATPIPRSLALTLYGDLDTSTLRQPPPGARPVLTRLVNQARSSEVYEYVYARLQAGQQAYFVYPLIEESEKLALKPALAMFQRLQLMFPRLRLGLMHGRLSAEEKNAVMQAFRCGDTQALVATTVIEVGLDVPNASLMVIEHAERFGLAQLHQLRGRICRPQPASPPPAPAACFLLHSPDAAAIALQRLHALAATRDGFALAELDLKLRGPGEFFGTRQSGLPSFQLAQPLRDRDLLELAQLHARQFLDQASPELLRLLVAEIQRRWQRPFGLFEAG